MIIIAHRGDCTNAEENTWDAFHSAVTIGCDRIELDIHLTKDGEFVVYHDEAIGSQFFKELTSLEVQDLTLKSGDKIPFLKDLLSLLLPKIELNIEMKDSSEAAVEALLPLIENHHLNSKIIISCFEIPPLESLLKKASHIQRALLTEDNFFEEKNSYQKLSDLLSQIQTRIVHPHVDSINQKFSDEMKKNGWIVYPWVSMKNREEYVHKRWDELRQLGIHGLCTNNPRGMKQWLKMH